ncbi:hypothetical protein YPPY66_4727 [Yersinia pestis PY-66]|uniref:Uncharacterized protein n=3 Tax=Yersinia pseudotuberculosis complex TaxID=1649845 RepID=A0A0U1R1Y9_YERP3|nr:hypothetical protein YpsIP31758_0199 [Yersinia pseudotuberculosis IP 31758]ADV97122.1 hypothetical protein YPC_0380 [Yersinia pestis biovar Medievalis str. Harbin 35]EDR31541.1 hypothetical protein YPIP275_3080 [Yersinia pestis biovar Orientalis str. IP275]EDR41765.1 hypothetical protein YpE1979001_1193 [Yersinia pestis biovar Antiqua str. E1979001]EDR49708.1 hypothetical protein YpB42003004_4601 [Yersinia pestis biovar Antiqua str. B42003004]EDR64551.1 hypothetical protein YpK1973002_4356 
MLPFYILRPILSLTGEHCQCNSRMNRADKCLKKQLLQ